MFSVDRTYCITNRKFVYLFIYLFISYAGFFFVAGYISEKKKDYLLPSKQYIRQKFKGLINPYIVYSIFYLLFLIIQIVFHIKSFNELIWNLIYTFNLSGISVLWFLPTLFSCSIIYQLLIKKYKNRLLMLIIICLSLVILIPTYYYICDNYTVMQYIIRFRFDRVILRPVILLPFMIIGGLIAKIDVLKHANLIIIGCSLFLFNIIVACYLPMIDINTIKLNNTLVFILLGTTGSIGLFCFSLYINRMYSECKLLEFLGEKSLFIMCLHEYFGFTFLSVVISKSLTQINFFQIIIATLILLFISVILSVFFADKINNLCKKYIKI